MINIRYMAYNAWRMSEVLFIKFTDILILYAVGCLLESKSYDKKKAKGGLS